MYFEIDSTREEALSSALQTIKTRLFWFSPRNCSVRPIITCSVFPCRQGARMPQLSFCRRHSSICQLISRWIAEFFIGRPLSSLSTNSQKSSAWRRASSALACLATFLIESFCERDNSSKVFISCRGSSWVIINSYPHMDAALFRFHFFLGVI